MVENSGAELLLKKENEGNKKANLKHFKRNKDNRKNSNKIGV